MFSFYKKNAIVVNYNEKKMSDQYARFDLVVQI